MFKLVMVLLMVSVFGVFAENTVGVIENNKITGIYLSNPNLKINYYQIKINDKDSNCEIPEAIIAVFYDKDFDVLKYYLSDIEIISEKQSVNYNYFYAGNIENIIDEKSTTSSNKKIIGNFVIYINEDFYNKTKDTHYPITFLKTIPWEFVKYHHLLKLMEISTNLIPINPKYENDITIQRQDPFGFLYGRYFIDKLIFEEIRIRE